MHDLDLQIDPIDGPMCIFDEQILPFEDMRYIHWCSKEPTDISQHDREIPKYFYFCDLSWAFCCYD